MALSEREAKMLEDLKKKEAESLSEADLERMDENIENLFQYKDAFEALMVWRQFASQLTTLAQDNSLLVREIRRMRDERDSMKAQAKPPPAQ